MADEMYLQKCIQYSGGDYVGADENLYKGIVVFMIQGLKHTVPLVVKASPEVSVSGQWLASNLSDCIESFGNAGFNVRGIVTDNHSANVSAFNHLQKMFPSSSGDVLCMQHPQNASKTYLFFDTVHLVKNICYNLLNASKFVFPAFSFSLEDQVLASSESGHIRWRDFQDIFEDAKHKANLRMAPKLTPCSFHPGNNKQNIGLALAIFHETTIAACKSYFPQRKDVIAFLSLLNSWWIMVNSKQRFHCNTLGNAVVLGDDKVEFFFALADWFKNWSDTAGSTFCLSKQTSFALVATLRAQARLMNDLLNEEYAFVLTARLQSDPIERRFAQYRLMNGGRFLVSLNEVFHTEKILLCRSLIKEKINFWKEPDLASNSSLNVDLLNCLLDKKSVEFSEALLSPESEEIFFFIAGYIAKKIKEKSGCKLCNDQSSGSTVRKESYFDLLTRGGLTIPSAALAHYVANCFAILDLAETSILQQCPNIPRRIGAKVILARLCNNASFSCDAHSTWGSKLVQNVVINIFFNNKQKIVTSSIRNEAVKTFKKR